MSETIEELKENYYHEWKRDNIIFLRRQFCDDNDDFEYFCKQEFKTWKDD